MILLIKTIHIISAIIWIAALFAIGKTMIAQHSMSKGDDTNNGFISNLSSSIYKMYANPAMMIAFVAGIALIAMKMAYMKEGWLHMKLLFLIILLVQHMIMKGQMKKLAAGTILSLKRLKSNILILILIVSAIVFMAVFKSGLNWMMFGALMLVEIGFGALLVNRK